MIHLFCFDRSNNRGVLMHGTSSGGSSFHTFVLCLAPIAILSGLVLLSPVFAATGKPSARETLAHARDLERQKQYSKAIAAYRRYLQIRPEDDDVRSIVANLSARQGAHDDAIALYRDILTRHPTDLDVRTALARVLSWEKRFAEAQRLYRNILREDAQQIDAAQGLGDVLFWTGRGREALPYYEQVYAATQDSAVATRIDSIKSNLAAFGKVVREGGTLPVMPNGVGDLSKAKQAEANKRYRQAIAAYHRYLQRHPGDDEVRANVAKLLAWEGQRDDAVRLYRDILTRHPTDVDIRLALATVLSWQKHFDEARQLYDQVLRERPDNREARRGLADVAFWQGRHAEALTQYESLNAEHQDADLTRQIQAVKAEMRVSPRAPVGQEVVGLRLPYRDYAKIGYGHYSYTKGIPDEWNALLEAGTSLENKTLIARVESLNRFGFHDVPVSTEFYSPLWSQAWGYIGAQGTVNPNFSPNYSLVGEVFQGLGAVHSFLIPLEGSFGYRHLRYKKDGIDLLMPGLTVYFPYNVWLTEKIYYIPDTGAITLASQLTWRPQERLQVFASGAFGTSSERIVAVQDFTRIQSRIIQGGMTFPLTERFSAEASGYYEDRGALYIRRGGLINLIIHW